MDKETLGLILIMGIAGAVIALFVVGGNAYGHTEYTTTYKSEFGGLYNVTSQTDIEHKILHISEQILEEEKKQTALLDQINCYMYYEYTGGYNARYETKAHEIFCGEPLNLTGVWDP